MSTDDHADTLPRRLERARIAAGLNRSQLAIRAGLNPSHVRLIEDGLRGDPSGTTLAKLAEVLGVSIDWLVRGVGEGPSAAPPAELTIERGDYEQTEGAA